MVSHTDPCWPSRLLQSRIQQSLCREISPCRWVRNRKAAESYDPKTGKFETIDACLSESHTKLANDKDQTLYASNNGLVRGLSGSVGSRRAYGTRLTTRRNRKVGALPFWTSTEMGKMVPTPCPSDPPDPKLDRAVAGASGYGLAINPVDGSAWYAAGVASSETQVPGKIIRIVPGDDPPATCLTEAYEPPFDNPKLPGVEAYSTLGIGIDTQGAGLGGAGRK